MNNIIALNGPEDDSFRHLVEYAKEWASQHNVMTGVAEMALGAAAITWGINIGAIDLSNIVFTLTDKTPEIVGGLSIPPTALLAYKFIGGIGIAACGGAIGIPACLVAGGAGLIFGLAGFKVSELISDFLHPIDWGNILMGGSLLTLGTVLVVDGAQRLLPDSLKDSFKHAVSAFKSGILFLGECVSKVIANSLNDLTSLYAKVCERLKELYKKNGVKETVNTTIIGGSAVAGTVVGTAAATSTVTVLGSSTLGSVALGLGIVSAPLWPVFLGGALAIAGGAGICYAIKCWLAGDDDVDLLMRDMLPY